jgi:hypothetical protein
MHLIALSSFWGEAHTATGELTLGSIQITGTNADQFRIAQDPSSPVAPGGNTALIVNFHPTSEGAKTALLRIASNDPDDEGQYDITLNGTCSAPIYPSGIVAYWKFDEGSGTTAYDSIGTANGTIYGATWTSGRAGGALNFDGLDDYVSLNTHDFINTSDSFSYSVWIKFNKDIGGTGSSGDPYEFSNMMIISIHDGPYLHLGTSGRIVSVATLQPPAPDVIVKTAKYNWTKDEWYHIAVTLDNSKMKIYVNGNLENEVAGGLKRSSGDSNHMKFGKWHYYDANYFNGAMDEFAVSNRALSPLEIQRHYLNGLLGNGYEAYPDLILESLTHNPANPTTADEITFTAVVKNIGNSSAGSSTLMFKIGGKHLERLQPSFHYQL